MDSRTDDLMRKWQQAQDELTVTLNRIADFATQWQKEFQKQKPILVTEDGLEVFDSLMTIYGLKESDWSIALTRSGNFQQWPGYKWFLSKVKRDEYILQNRPLLSIKDVHKCTHYDPSIGGYETSFLELQNLVRQRLQNQ